MFAVIRASFNQRRKTLVNGLAGGGLGLSKEDVAAALSEMGLSENVRGETLTLEQFAKLSDILFA
jgi:16S rRNA (adenine1518-N6/adenine1519-N6)-dimethyltransferase